MGNQKAFKLSISIFILVWSHLSHLYKKRELFALNWITRSDQDLHIFLSKIIGMKVGRVSRGFLFNGYKNCRSTSFDTFSIVTWKKIDTIFLQSESLPKPIKSFCRALNQDSLSSLLNERINECSRNNTFSNSVVFLPKLDKALVTPYLKCFLGNWPEEFIDSVPLSKLKLFKQILESYKIISSGKNRTFFYDNTVTPPLLVAVHFKQNVLRENELVAIRSLLEQMCAGHSKIIRGGSKLAFDSQMTAFGPRWDRFKRHGGKKVSFYTAVLKINKLLRECPSTDAAKQFQLLVDKYAHNNLMEIIVALCLWWCPDVLGTFLDYSAPYLTQLQHEQSSLERDLGGNGPSAYQVYITKDYCSTMHADADITSFTLCYSSHPDAASGAPPVDFCMSDIGCRLPIGNGDLFAFRSSMVHGTIHRAKTSNAAYMGCLVVNKSVHNLMRRRVSA